MLINSPFISKRVKSFVFNPLNPLCERIKTTEKRPFTIDQLSRKTIAATETIDPEALGDIHEAVLSPQEIAEHSLLSQEAYCAHWKEQLEQAIKSSFGASISEAKISKVTAQYAANFLGGGIITGGPKATQLDGFESLTNYAIWQKLFQELAQQISDPESHEAQIIVNLANGFDQLHRFHSDMEQLSAQPDVKSEEIYNVAMRYAEQVDALKTGESLLLPAGYCNQQNLAESHAQTYEVCCAHLEFMMFYFIRRQA